MVDCGAEWRKGLTGSVSLQADVHLLHELHPRVCSKSERNLTTWDQPGAQSMRYLTLKITSMCAVLNKIECIFYVCARG